MDFKALLELAAKPNNPDGTRPYLVEMVRLSKTDHKFALEEVYFWHLLHGGEKTPELPWLEYCQKYVNEQRTDDCFFK